MEEFKYQAVAISNALNAIQDMGLLVRLKHNILLTDVGIILEVDGKWVPRIFVGDDLPPKYQDLEDD